MKVPEILYPLVRAGLLKLWHDTSVNTFPPGARLSVSWAPTGRVVYLVFGMTFGHPRDVATGNVLTTPLFGFWHKHPEMLWHWDPMVESVYLYRHPHLLKVTRNTPIELEWYNNTLFTISQDVTIWLFEVTEDDWETVQAYFDGILNKAVKEAKP